MNYKPLDFVTPSSNDLPKTVGIITEVSLCQNYSRGEEKLPDFYQASVAWIGGEGVLKTAWWGFEELTVIDNLPHLLTKSLVHPFANGAKFADIEFPINHE